ncbi:MAG TPA: cation:proton antiporter [Stellaceae bacterium]
MPQAATLFFGQALIIVGAPYLLWRHLGLRSVVPLVVVQILCGMMLGPSGLGALAPDIWRAVFPPQSVAALSGLASLAVVLFSFLSGLHLDFLELRRSGPGLALVGVGSIVVPATLGTLAGGVIAAAWPAEIGAGASVWQFSLAIGISLGITALPVLAAILRESGLLDSRAGSQALVCAAVNDGLLWLFLALLIAALGRSDHSGVGGGPLATLAMPVLSTLYLAVAVLVVRPLLARLLSPPPDGRPLGEAGTVLVVGTVAASSFAAELIGLHYVIGGFAAGAVMPAAARRAIAERLETVTVVVLLPFFFVLTGLKTSFSAGSFAALAGIFAIATAATMLGKMIGTALPARWIGESWPHALTLGAMMQSKGLMEVVVLTVLLDAGVLTPTGFTALVLMALVTTAATKPLLYLTGAVRRGSGRAAAAVPARP